MGLGREGGEDNTVKMRDTWVSPRVFVVVNLTGTLLYYLSTKTIMYGTI